MLSFWRPSAQKRLAHRLYTEAVKAARNPVFYTRFGVADTLDGRFDMIVLHLGLLGDRLIALGEGDMYRRVQELFLQDMDRSLREIGVGDLSVGKQIKTMGAALLGRTTAYREALHQGENEGALRHALSRNIYRSDEKVTEAAADLAHYVRLMAAQIDTASLDMLKNDTIWQCAEEAII